MRNIFAILIGVSLSSLGGSQDIPNRKPDVVSQRAKIEEYYQWNGTKWVWSGKEDRNKVKIKAIKKLKGEVYLGEPTIREIPEEIPAVKCVPNLDNKQCKEKK